MACCTLRLAFENLLAALSRFFIEAPLRRLRRRNAKLVELQSGKLRRDQIRGVSDVAKTRCRSHGELSEIIEPRIEERPLTVHLQIRHKRIPIRHGTPSSPGMQVHARESECRWNQYCGCLSIRAKGCLLYTSDAADE